MLKIDHITIKFGGLVANIAVRLGMKVVGCDPFLSVDAAWNLNHNITHAASYEEVYKVADYITIHVPATADTKGMINASTMAGMKDGVKIINLSRDSLVKSADMIEALASGKVSRYVTDFATPELIGVKGAILIPHLGASTEESEDNCAKMAVKQVMDYLENGNIVNSVNFPNCDMGICTTAGRITILHKNIPNSLSRFTTAMASENINIAGLEASLTITYTLYADGNLTIKEALDVNEEAKHKPMPSRFGMQWVMPKEYDMVNYYGRGPEENYIDRKESQHLGIFKQSVAAQYHPYVRPQESGNHCDVRYWRVLNAKGEVVGRLVGSSSAEKFIASMRRLLANIPAEE